MSRINLILFRHLSTSQLLRRPKLGVNYKSKELWNQRFNCRLLNGDETIISTINNKIINGSSLDNSELDIFINIATASQNDLAQLQESVKLVRDIRSSLHAHTLLPSTAHALCRLFLDVNRNRTLLTLLEDRIKYGIFPDFFTLNILIDEALEKKDYVSAARLASLVMLQEEFGLNKITDLLSLYSVSKYLESKTNFQNWIKVDEATDPILNSELQIESLDDLQTKEENNPEVQSEKVEELKTEKVAEEAQEEEEEEEDEEDAEYVRIPFLRNPYHDGHFDIVNPRLICGKTLKLYSLTPNPISEKLATSCSILGQIIEGKWSEAATALDKVSKSGQELANIKETAEYYIENLHGLNAPTEDEKKSILDKLQKIPNDGKLMSQMLESNLIDWDQHENEDIQNFKSNLEEWSSLRQASRDRVEKKQMREQLLAEIEAKKKELREKEQYLYFYDNLRKSRYTRIMYD